MNWGHEFVIAFCYVNPPHNHHNAKIFSKGVITVGGRYKDPSKQVMGIFSEKCRLICNQFNRMSVLHDIDCTLLAEELKSQNICTSFSQHRKRRHFHFVLLICGIYLSDLIWIVKRLCQSYDMDSNWSWICFTLHSTMRTSGRMQDIFTYTGITTFSYWIMAPKIILTYSAIQPACPYWLFYRKSGCRL